MSTGVQARGGTSPTGSIATRGVRASSNYDRRTGVSSTTLGPSPVFNAPLTSDTVLTSGTGSATFTRATAARYYNSSGLVASVTSGNPRFTYDSTGVTLQGYLSELARTNLALESEDFTAAWSASSVTVTADTQVAPDGATTADTLNATANNHNTQQGITVNASTTYIFSFWAKRGTATDCKYSVFDNTHSADIVAPTSYFASINSGTFTRVVVSFATPAGCVSASIYVLRDSGVTGTTFVWGAQLEAASFVSTYNPTVAVSVARNADLLSYPTTSNLGTNNQTVYMDWTPQAASLGTIFLLGSFVDASNYTAILHDGTNVIARRRISGSNHDAVKALAYSAGTTYKIVARFSSSTGSDIFVNGAIGTNDATNTALQVGTTLEVGSDGNGANQDGSAHKNVKIYNSSLSDSAIAAL